jgi:hypothetical protein
MASSLDQPASTSGRREVSPVISTSGNPRARCSSSWKNATIFRALSNRVSGSRIPTVSTRDPSKPGRTRCSSA